MLSGSTRRPINTIQKDDWRRELLPTNVIIKLTDRTLLIQSRFLERS